MTQVSFPDSQSASAASSSAAPPSIGQDQGKRIYRILLVDDVEGLRDMFKAIAPGILEPLKAEGAFDDYEIDEACDGLEAVAQSFATYHDLTFMDVMMPNKDGLEATREIRTQEELLKKEAAEKGIDLGNKGHRFIVGYSDTDPEKGMAAGMDEFYKKPSPLRVVKQIIERSLGRNATG